MNKVENIRIILVSVLLCCLIPVESRADEMQKALRIQEIFQQYGKKKNVTMVELSNEMLEAYNLTHYKSIVIKEHPEALVPVRQCLEADQKEARKIKEVTANGEVVSAYYQLPGNGERGNRFILFKAGKKGEITLIYIEGEIDLEDLITILFTKKDF